MVKNSSGEFDRLLIAARGCSLCASQLAHGVRPVLQAATTSRILIAGQAPGARVHASGVPFDDASGDRLRDWMGGDRSTFYDATRVAILPMGFCFPGAVKGKGDLPPIPLCAETWRDQILSAMREIRLTLVIGPYAQAWHLGDVVGTNLTETVRQWQDYGNALIPMPHPSPRNNIWLKRNPWFEVELVPELRRRVALALQSPKVSDGSQ